MAIFWCQRPKLDMAGELSKKKAPAWIHEKKTQAGQAGLPVINNLQVVN